MAQCRVAWSVVRGSGAGLCRGSRGPARPGPARPGPRILPPAPATAGSPCIPTVAKSRHSSVLTGSSPALPLAVPLWPGDSALPDHPSAAPSAPACTLPPPPAPQAWPLLCVSAGRSASHSLCAQPSSAGSAPHLKLWCQHSLRTPPLPQRSAGPVPSPWHPAPPGPMAVAVCPHWVGAPGQPACVHGVCSLARCVRPRVGAPLHPAALRLPVCSPRPPQEQPWLVATTGATLGAAGLLAWSSRSWAPGCPPGEHPLC